MIVARRVYQYGIAFATVWTIVVGLSGLLEVALEAVAESAAGPFVTSGRLVYADRVSYFGALTGIGRAWANEILHRARLSPYKLSRELDRAEIERLAATIDEALTEGIALREAGASDAKAYRIHGKLGQPCPACGTWGASGGPSCSAALPSALHTR